MNLPIDQPRARNSASSTSNAAEGGRGDERTTSFKIVKPEGRLSSGTTTRTTDETFNRHRGADLRIDFRERARSMSGRARMFRRPQGAVEHKPYAESEVKMIAESSPGACSTPETRAASGRRRTIVWI